MSHVENIDDLDCPGTSAAVQQPVLLQPDVSRHTQQPLPVQQCSARPGPTMKLTVTQPPQPPGQQQEVSHRQSTNSFMTDVVVAAHSVRACRRAYPAR